MSKRSEKVAETIHETISSILSRGLNDPRIGFVTIIAVEVTDDGHLTLRAEEHGPGQERITYLRREWSYGPYARTIELPCAVDAGSANVSFGNGVLSLSLSKTSTTAAGEIRIDRTGHARGLALGHSGRGHDAEHVG